MDKLIVTITGPSGSGKTELVHALCEHHNFSKLVSVTTRPKRPGEVEGKDYYFVSEEEFTKLEQNEQLVQATTFNGCSYGTTVAELQRVTALGRIPIVIVEPTGVPQFEAVAKIHGYRLKAIFMTASHEVLVERYLRRITEATSVPDKVKYHAKRISGIASELDWGATWEFDMQIVNDIDDLSAIGRMANFVGETCGQG